MIKKVELQQTQSNDFEVLRERAYKFITLCEQYLQQNSIPQLNEGQINKRQETK